MNAHKMIQRMLFRRANRHTKLKKNNCDRIRERKKYTGFTFFRKLMII